MTTLTLVEDCRLSDASVDVEFEVVVVAVTLVIVAVNMVVVAVTVVAVVAMQQFKRGPNTVSRFENNW